MNVDYTGRNTAVTIKQRKQAEGDLARIATIAGRVVSAHVILTVDKYRQIAEVTMKTRDESLVAKCEATDMYAALHDAMRCLEQQAVRQRQRKTTLTRHPRMTVRVEPEWPGVMAQA
jgi:putative sigma-54 modulation protein